MFKDLTEHQRGQLRYFSDIESRGEKVVLGAINMSVLAALIRRNLITIRVTPEGQRTLDEADQEYRAALLALSDRGGLGHDRRRGK